MVFPRAPSTFVRPLQRVEKQQSKDWLLEAQNQIQQSPLYDPFARLITQYIQQLRVSTPKVEKKLNSDVLLQLSPGEWLANLGGPPPKATQEQIDLFLDWIRKITIIWNERLSNMLDSYNDRLNAFESELRVAKPITLLSENDISQARALLDNKAQSLVDGAYARASEDIRRHYRSLCSQCGEREIKHARRSHTEPTTQQQLPIACIELPSFTPSSGQPSSVKEPKPARSSFTAEQKSILNAYFMLNQASPYADRRMRAQLARSTGLDGEQIRTWLSNKRNRIRRRLRRLEATGRLSLARLSRQATVVLADEPDRAGPPGCVPIHPSLLACVEAPPDGHDNEESGRDGDSLGVEHNDAGSAVGGMLAAALDAMTPRLPPVAGTLPPAGIPSLALVPHSPRAHPTSVTAAAPCTAVPCTTAAPMPAAPIAMAPPTQGPVDSLFSDFPAVGFALVPAQRSEGNDIDVAMAPTGECEAEAEGPSSAAGEGTMAVHTSASTVDAEYTGPSLSPTPDQDPSGLFRLNRTL